MSLMDPMDDEQLDAIIQGLERIKSLEAEIARLRLTDAEREFLQALHNAYEESANQTGYVNAAAQADSRKNAAIIRGLLERTR